MQGAGHRDCALTLVVKKLPAQLCPLDMGGQLLVCLLNHALLIVGLLESFKGVTFNDKMKELRNCLQNQPIASCCV